MILAKGLGPSSVLPRLALVLLGTGLVAGCQSNERSARPAVQPETWQVVERLGDARYQAPGGASAPAMPADRLPPGSGIATGTGGRLIVARPGTVVSAGPASRFTLPDGAPAAPLEQRGGQLRYRVAEASPAGLAVLTPFLDLELGAGVVEVTVDAGATEVAVEHGRVRIATPDGRRQVELHAGQSAYASGPEGDALLAFRRAPQAPLEPVEAMVVPAMQPRAEVGEGRAVAAVWRGVEAAIRASSSGAAASAATVPIARAKVVAATAAAPAVPSAPGRSAQQSQLPRAAGGQGAPATGALPAPEAALESAPGMPSPATAGRLPAGPAPARQAVEEPPPTAFDRLSEGMVDGLARAFQMRVAGPDGRAL